MRGKQIKYIGEFQKAVKMLYGQGYINMATHFPKAWELSEEYRSKPLPRISYDKRDPWKYMHRIELKKTKVPKYGPIHGYVPEVEENALDNWINKDKKFEEWIQKPRAKPWVLNDKSTHEPEDQKMLRNVMWNYIPPHRSNVFA